MQMSQTIAALDHSFCGVIVVAALMGAACSTSPTSPSGTAAANLPSILGAKPGGPPPSSYSVSFVPPGLGSSPGHLEGSGSLQGSFTGSPTSSNLLGSASGLYTLTVTDVGPLPDGASTPGPCPTDKLQLIAAGILGVPLSGALTVNVDQDGEGGGGFRHSQMTWEMTNIPRSDGTWRIAGNSTFNYPALFAGTATTFTATLENGVINFFRYPAGSRKADLSVGCRVDLVMTVSQ